MYCSIESRWFFPEGDKQLDKIISWFSDIPEWKSTEGMVLGDKWDRSDFYLDVKGYTGMSFKIREGKAEVKMLEKDFGVMDFGEAGKGKVEKWIKWSTDLRDPHGVPETLFKEPQNFIEISKTRLLLKYEIADGRVFRVDPSRMNVINGCQVELTKIKCNGKLVFSFGFESMGEAEKLLRNFRVISRNVLADLRTRYKIKLTASTSYGYPQFLAKAK